MAQTRIRNSAKSKEDILEAAEIEFAEKGFYGARIDEISSKANINKRMIYEYFINKENLYKTVLITVYKRLGDREFDLLSRETDTISAIRRIIQFHFEFLHENPTFVSLILWENLNKGKYIKELDWQSIKDPTLVQLRKVLRKGKEDGSFKNTLDEEQFILTLLTFNFSYFSNRHTLSKLLNRPLDDTKNLKKRMEHVTEMILLYLCK